MNFLTEIDNLILALLTWEAKGLPNTMNWEYSIYFKLSELHFNTTVQNFITTSMKNLIWQKSAEETMTCFRRN